MQTAYIPVPTPARPAAPTAWSAADILALYELPFMDLVFRAQQTHRAHFDPNVIQLSSLLSIKTGGCPRIAPTARSRRTTTPAWTPTS